MIGERWICCQLGAREHYAVPRALAAKGRLHTLLTDAWTPPRSLLGRAPRRGILRRYQERYHPDLSGARVHGFNLAFLAFEVSHRLRRTPGWPRIMARNTAFQKAVVQRLGHLKTASSDRPTTLFAYSYAAREILRYARTRGWRTVLGQIDPGPVESQIVRAEAAEHPQFGQGDDALPPAGYWTQWQEECDLADTIVVNSPWSAQCLEAVGIPAGKVRCVPLAYQLDPGEHPAPKSYPAQFTAERPLRVLFLGQVNLRKGVARLLQAARALRDEPVEFWMIGPVECAGFAAAGSPRMRWLGPVSRHAAAEYYRLADVFLLPTLSDGFALTQLEALARRLPVIASSHCGQVVRDGTDGRILLAPTAEAIVAALRECLREPERLAVWSRAAGVRPEFTLPAVAESLLQAAHG